MTLMGIVIAQNNADSGVKSMTVLKQDSGANLSEMNVTLYTVSTDWGLDAFGVGEAVKFTAPEPGWKLMQVRILGWNGFNETTRTIPPANNFLIEIRDGSLNLLYRMADTQNAYFTYPAPVIRAIDIPALPLTGDFYVIFYDRGAMVAGMETENGTGNSYFYDSLNSNLISPSFKDANNKSTQINWVIRAVGE
jgi:hypothetical protein